MVICLTAPPSHVKSLKEERWGLEQLKRKTSKYEKYAFSENLLQVVLFDFYS